MTLADHANAHLRKVGLTGIMWGDVHLAHEILERAKLKHRGPESIKFVLDHLENSPLFEKRLIRLNSGRWVRYFELVAAA